MSLKNSKKKFATKKPGSSNGPKEDQDNVKSSVGDTKGKHIVFESDDESNVASTPVAKPTPPPKTKGQKSREDALEIGTAWYRTVGTQILRNKF